jgi:catalase
VLEKVRTTAHAQQILVEIVAPTVNGVRTSAGKELEADQKVDGGPSVLYDAVVVLPGPGGAAMLAELPPARDFISDAFAHCKFIGHNAEARELFAAVGLADKIDDGVVDLSNGSVATFFAACTQLRHWGREAIFARQELSVPGDG